MHVPSRIGCGGIFAKDVCILLGGNKQYVEQNYTTSMTINSTPCTIASNRCLAKIAPTDSNKNHIPPYGYRIRPLTTHHSIISTWVHSDRLRHMPQSSSSLELIRFNPKRDIHKAPVRHDLSHMLRLHLVRCEWLPMLAPKRSRSTPEACHKLGRPSCSTCCNSAHPQS